MLGVVVSAARLMPREERREMTRGPDEVKDRRNEEQDSKDAQHSADPHRHVAAGMGVYDCVSMGTEAVIFMSTAQRVGPRGGPRCSCW